MELYEEDEETKNIGSCKIYNPTLVPAVVTLSVATYSMGDNEIGSGLRNYLIPGHSCKEIRADLGMRDVFALGMNLSQNLPGENILEWTSSKDLSKTKDGKTGIWDVDSAIFTGKSPGMIVNAEDPGFVIHEKKRKGKLAAYFSKGKNEKKYSYVYDHEHWTLTTDSHCYGDIVKSAYYKIAGTGKSKVEWKVNVENPGKYEVFVYVPDVEATSARKVFIGGARLFYQVTSADDVTDVEVLLDNEEPGWISLGKYYFDRGEYSVFLSDRGGDSLTWENCYAAGEVISMNSGAAGIGAYFDTAPKRCVALNKLVENKKNGVNLGRIAAFMGAANMTVVDCWATDDMKILNAGVPKTEFSGELVGVKQPHDGETKSKEFLSNMQNYLDAGWGNSWYYKVNAKGYPILLWQYNREDYNTDITGH